MKKEIYKTINEIKEAYETATVTLEEKENEVFTGVVATTINDTLLIATDKKIGFLYNYKLTDLDNIYSKSNYTVVLLNDKNEIVEYL